jgi:hypothetical protein
VRIPVVPGSAGYLGYLGHVGGPDGAQTGGGLLDAFGLPGLDSAPQLGGSRVEVLDDVGRERGTRRFCQLSPAASDRVGDLAVSAHQARSTTGSRSPGLISSSAVIRVA